MHGDEDVLLGSFALGAFRPSLSPTRKENQMTDGTALNLLLLWMLIQSLRQ